MLHLSECPESAVCCIVPGCTTMVKQKDVLQHSINAASAHIVLQEEEIQLLQCLMHFQVRCLNYKNIKKKDVIWTWTEHSVSFQRTKPRWSLKEKGVFSFCWRGEKWSDIWEPQLYSTESRCPNGNRWRAHLQSAGMSLELVSEAMPVVEETRSVNHLIIKNRILLLTLECSLEDKWSLLITSQSACIQLTYFTTTINFLGVRKSTTMSKLKLRP